MGNDERRPGRSAIFGYPEDPLLYPGTRKGWPGSEFGDVVQRNYSPKNDCGNGIVPVCSRYKKKEHRVNSSKSSWPKNTSDQQNHHTPQHSFSLKRKMENCDQSKTTDV